MATNARYKLIEVITSNSVSKDWESAVNEWSMTGCKVDSSCSSSCVCGQENIKYLFKITNQLNGNKLFPIGSRCIHKFGRHDLDEIVNVHEQMCKLLEAVKEHRYIEFTSDLFSKKLITYLYEEGAFPPTQFNMNDPVRDYNFLMDMFKQRKEPTELQKRKIKALIVTAILPYCRSKISEV